MLGQPGMARYTSRQDRRMPKPPAALPPEFSTSFTCAEALASGVSTRRLRAKDLETPFRGVRSAVSQKELPSREEPLELNRAVRLGVLRRAHAYALIMPPHAFFAGRTAAVLYGAPLAHGEELDVAVHAPARPMRRRGIRCVKVSPHLASVRELEGLRLSSPASTWAMLGATLTERQLVIVGDAFVRVPRDDRGTPTCAIATTDDLRFATAAGPRPGVARLRQALLHIRVGSSSPLETEYRLDAAAAGLPDAELDVEIRGADGRRIGITEVVYRRWRVLVEVEGDHHRTSRAQWNRDIEKYAAYVAAGWEVVRLTSAHVRGGRAPAIVATALSRHGWQPA
jgi:hypothetical protein